MADGPSAIIDRFYEAWNRYDAAAGAACFAADRESAVRAAIAAMSGSDRVMSERLHERIEATAPELSPKTWYEMPPRCSASTTARGSTMARCGRWPSR